MRLRSLSILVATVVAVLLVFGGTALAAASPPLINQEGLLLDEFGFPVDSGNDTVQLTFRLYRQKDGGGAFWNEGHAAVVESGYYSVLLGSITPLSPDDLDEDEVWLSIQVGGNAEMAPRQRVVSAPYAIQASVTDNAVGDITPASVTTDRIEADTGSILDNFTVAAVLDAGSLAVQGDGHVFGGLTVDGVIRGDLAPDTVETSDVRAGAITEPKLADGAVTERAIADHSVTTAKIANSTIKVEDFHDSVFEAFGAAGGAAGGRPFVINADLIDGVDSSQLVRSDVSDSLGGDQYEMSGLLLASVGADGAHGIGFQGPSSDAFLQLDSAAGGSELQILQQGGASDGVALETQGGPISLRGGAVDITEAATVGTDLTVGGNVYGRGNIEVTGHGTIEQNLIVGGTADIARDATFQSNATVRGDASTGFDMDVGRDLRVGNAARVTGTLTADSQITATSGDIVALDGDVVAHGDVRTTNGDVVAGGSVRASRAIVPAGGVGNAGVVWGALPGDPSDRAWLQYYGDGGTGTFEVAVGDDGDDVLMLAASGGVLVRDSNPTDRLGPGANLDVGGELRVGRNALFENDVEVIGVVDAIEVAADLLTVETEVAIDSLLTAEEVRVTSALRVENDDGTATLYADNISGRLADDMVTSNAIGAGAVGRSHLSGEAVHSGNIMDLGINTIDLADNAVTSAKIADQTILGADLAANAVLEGKIGDGQVTSAKIRDGDVRAVDLANDAVTSDKILDGQVKAADLGAGAVTTDRLADGAVTGTKVFNGSLTGDDLANDSVHGSKLVGGSVTGTQLQDGGVGSGDLADGAVTRDKLANNAVSGIHIVDGSLKAGDLDTDSVTTKKIKNGTILAEDLATGAVTSNVLATGAVTTVDIGDGQVGTADLAAGAVGTLQIKNGTIQPEDLAFECSGGGGGGGGGAVDGNIEFPVKNKGIIWRDGEGGSQHWFLRRMDEHLVFLEPETGDTEHMRIRDGGGVFAPYGFDAGDKGVDGGGFRLKGKSVIQSDRDAFLKRLFLTDTDTSDSSSGGAGSVNFPKMRNGERPYLAVKEDTEHGAKRDELHIYVGESSSDQLEVRAGGGLLLNHTRLEVQATACDAPVPTPANPDPPCRNPANTPLFAIYDAKQKDDGWEEDAQKHVFTPYMAGLGGAHVNDDKEKILIGNQPQWADAVYLWGKADFDNGQLDYGPNLRGTHRWYNSNDWHGYTYVYVRNDTGNHSTWSYGYKETYCREDEAHHCSSNLRVDYNRCWWSGNCNWDDMEATNTVSVVAAPSPPGTDGDGHNTHSLRLRSYADGIKDNATGNSWGQAYTYQFWRLYWDPSDFPAGAIVAKAGFWMRQREEIAFQPGRTGNGGTQVYMWGMEDDQYIRGGGAQGNNDWIYYQYNWNQGEGVHDYDWQEVLIKGDLLYQGNNVYLQSYNYGQYMAITQDLYIDTIEFSFLTANLSEMQVFADTKHWGSLHVLGELKVAGRKSFVQQHPTDPSKEINYVAMEGGESGTYWRGTARLKDGVAVVQLPEHFSLVTAHEGLTATVTLREPGPAIYASEVTNRRLVVRTADRSRADVTFDFIVLGVRKGFEDHVPVRHRQPRQLQRTAADGTPVTSVSFH